MCDTGLALVTTHWLCGLEKVTFPTFNFSFNFLLCERMVWAVGTSSPDILGILPEACALVSFPPTPYIPT